MTANHDCNNRKQNESFKASIDSRLRVEGKKVSLKLLKRKKRDWDNTELINR